jgi:hypothetical protein
MPRIAVVTAFADNIACLIPKLGIDRSEWGARGEDKAATFFYAASELPPEASPPPRLLAVPDITPALDLWGSEAELSTYDLALLSCEGYEAVKNKGPAAFAAMTQYLAKGGRIFGSHEEHLWYQRSPDHGLQSAVKFHGDSVPMSIDTSFPKGKALADWLHALAPMTAYGAFKVPGMFDPAAQVDPNRVRSWVTAQDPQLSGVFTINMPVGAPAENQCGKGVHFETHVTDSQVSNSKASFAESCAGELTPGETLLSFLFFDLASCIQDEAKAPKPPEVSPK